MKKLLGLVLILFVSAVYARAAVQPVTSTTTVHHPQTTVHVLRPVTTVQVNRPVTPGRSAVRSFSQGAATTGVTADNSAQAPSNGANQNEKKPQVTAENKSVAKATPTAAGEKGLGMGANQTAAKNTIASEEKPKAQGAEVDMEKVKNAPMPAELQKALGQFQKSVDMFNNKNK